MPPLGNAAIDSKQPHVAVLLQGGLTIYARLAVSSGSGLFQS
jgi:hypothetical protein